MSQQDLPPSVRGFISRFIRSVEQLEILLLFGREPDTIWFAQKVYDAILSTPVSVERWLDELARHGLLEKVSDPSVGYRCCRDQNLLSQVASLGEVYRTTPVRVIEAIYRRDANAAQSFADAFKIKTPDQTS